VRILFIFIDGVGIGKNDPLKNPCALPGIRLFNHFCAEKFPKRLLYGGVIKPIDAQLGTAGFPQSATGQTAIFTGKNVARILGKHLSGFPNNKLRELLTQYSILHRITQLGKKAGFINAYRPIFFDQGPEKLIRFLSVTSIMNWKAGLKFFDFDDLHRGCCIYHDFSNQELIKKGFNVREFSPERAAQILTSASREFDFLLYEYFKTDYAGHSQNMAYAVDLLGRLEAFLLNVIQRIDLDETLFIITSDHGNIEDLTLKSHTLNPVPLMVWGKGNTEFVKQVDSVLDITPTILKFLSSGEFSESESVKIVGTS